MKKKQLNVVFALISIGLLVIAILAAVFTDNPIMRTSVQDEPSESTMPENHPPLETSQQLTDLMRNSAENPQDASLLNQMGNLYYDQGDYSRAAVSYQKSLDISPHNPPVETDLATCLYNLGRYDEALEHLDHVIESDPGFTQALYNKGIVLIQGKKDTESGIQAWEQLLQTEPDPARREELQQNIQQLRSAAR